MAEIGRALRNPGRPAKIRKESTYDELYDNNNDFSLRSYQIEGLNWMVWNWQNKRNSILADEMVWEKLVKVQVFYNIYGKMNLWVKKSSHRLGNFS